MECNFINEMRVGGSVILFRIVYVILWCDFLSDCFSGVVWVFIVCVFIY